ncbi:gastrokine-1 [Tympanuchus pallidicinctus]|uniref:gastrokine-1 n=1 Tax=Tympanuchus pallidicinctus TaxID=109042 RepID=UPI002286E7B5|nr:gastrokine-1 [Tympanuchus pallidicinctus]
MKFTIVATVLLGLVLTPALSQFQFQNVKVNGGQYPRTITVNVGFGLQTLTISPNSLVAIIQSDSAENAWTTVWNYGTGYIATKLGQEGVCYISTMNRVLMPALNSIAVYAEESNNVKGESVLSSSIRYVVSRRQVGDLMPYGNDIFALCSGLPTFLAFEESQQEGVNQIFYNQNACYRLDVLNLVGIDYCRAGKV